jgi:hypothetical protein
VALDDRDRGGLATLGLLQCASEGVDSSTGLITARDLAGCAQGHVASSVKLINTRLAGKAYLPHQLMVYGNGEKLYSVKANAAAPTALATAQTGPVSSSKADQVLAAFEKFAANSNGNWGLRIEPSAYAVAVGQPVRLHYQTSQPGFVQLLYVASDRTEISRMWPSEGQTRRLNGTEGDLPIKLTLTAPAGDNTLLMVLSQQPMNLDAILRGGSAAASPAVIQQLGCELMRQRNIVVKEDSAPSQDCGAPASSLAGQGAIAQGATDGYTARVITLKGTP